MMSYKICCTVLLLLCLAGCQAAPPGTGAEIAATPPETSTAQAIGTSNGSEGSPPAQLTATASLADYAFPEQIDPALRYLFYLHDKIFEDQGLPAVSPDYGEYEYGAILQRLSEHGFRVISEQRPQDTDGWEYAQRVAELIQSQVALYGNVLSVYDSADQYAGSCAELFEYSQGKGLTRHEEIVLQVGTGHGILFQPLDEWVAPVVEWAGGQ